MDGSRAVAPSCEASVFLQACRHLGSFLPLFLIIKRDALLAAFVRIVRKLRCDSRI